MARNFSKDVMNNYFLMLDHFNFMQNDQKDKFLSQKTNQNDYFGPFVMECIFARFVAKHPVVITDVPEFRTNLWRFLPFLFNLAFSDALKIIKTNKEKFYVFENH